MIWLMPGLKVSPLLGCRNYGLYVCLLILGAGTESSGGVITWAIYELARRADLAETLRQTPKQIPAFTEEILRLHSSVPGSYRTVLKDTRLHGVSIPKGAVVMIRWDDDNLDPKRFSCLYELDLTRSNSRQHLTFGHGIHNCMGSSLARKDFELTVKAMLTRFSSLKINAHQPLTRIAAINYHLLTELPLLLTPQGVN